MKNLELARSAARKAMQVRSTYKIEADEGLCPYDLARQMDIKVSFLKDAPTLEGMYSPDAGAVIILGTERPAGRKRYTCAHEIGHHAFEHGMQLDQLDESNSASSSPVEFVAQRFAGALLMPKLAVCSAFARRRWKISDTKPEQFFVVAQELGVGFSALITHMEVSLREIDPSQTAALKRAKLEIIRAGFAGEKVPHDVFPVDAYWKRSTVDVEVGDRIVLEPGASFNGTCAQPKATGPLHLEATTQGIGQISLAGRTILLRVSRREFDGLAMHRHLEDVQ